MYNNEKKTNFKHNHYRVMLNVKMLVSFLMKHGKPGERFQFYFGYPTILYKSLKYNFLRLTEWYIRSIDANKVLTASEYSILVTVLIIVVYTCNHRGTPQNQASLHIQYQAHAASQYDHWWRQWARATDSCGCWMLSLEWLHLSPDQATAEVQPV